MLFLLLIFILKHPTLIQVVFQLYIYAIFLPIFQII